jgi:3-isopropylmalate/(R)-2-methylmalate dehydratase large subunit
MTITEKILSAHVDGKKVRPGEFIRLHVDVALANDITAPIAIKEFEKSGVEKLYDPDRIIFVLDHFTPNKDIDSANQCKFVRNFARVHGIKNFFDGGNCGVEHALLPEKGLVLPGDVIIGADSHTCTYGGLGAFASGVGSTDLAAAMMTGQTWFMVPETIKIVFSGETLPWVGGKDLILYLIGKIGVDGALYKSMEITGDAIRALDLSGRLTIANMVVEAGAKSGIMEADQKTLDYIEMRSKRPFKIYRSDSDANFESVHEFDCADIEPQVAFPHLPEKARGISDVGQIRIDQVVIGSCTNGRIEDLRIAADILKGRHVDKDVRCIILPATPEIYLKAEEEGLLKIFLQSGAVLGPPTCGPCLGGHMGILAEGERAVSTTNRNFVGRMGHRASEIYLAGPAVAAASAITGKISSPEEVM